MADEERRERPAQPISVSVCVLLSNHPDRLILARHLNNTWGPIAGRVRLQKQQVLRLENFLQAALRETEEETGIESSQIISLVFDQIIQVTGESKVRLGIIFEGALNPTYELPKEGVAVPPNDETNWIKSFDVGEIAGLLHTPREIYLPEINVPVLAGWARETVRFKWEGEKIEEAILRMLGLDEASRIEDRVSTILNRSDNKPPFT